MSRRFFAVAIMVLVAVLVIGVPLWRSGGPAQQSVVVTEAAQAAPAPPAATRPADNGAVKPEEAGAATLPPLDAPLRLVIDDLMRRADAGDVAAACRVAAELERCGELRLTVGAFSATRREMQRLVDEAPGEHRHAFVSRLEEIEAMAATAVDGTMHCAGIPEPDPGERARYWRTAALGGHPAAVRHYAIGNAFRFDDMMGAVPELATYHNEAEAMARQAAMGGDLAMLHALAMAYLPPDDTVPETARPGRRTFLAQVVRPDAGQALAVLFAMQRHPTVRGLPQTHRIRLAVEFGLERLLMQEDAATVSKASATADAWSRTWTPTREDPAELGIFVNGGLSDVPREACGPG
ncbi:hypothetical protein [Luteimonas qiangzhengi]|uniref:hypothetical protein n=1 Tax=Luteimonas sp. MJ146 TaxID=3129240 RepID=UPI0031BB6C68